MFTKLLLFIALFYFIINVRADPENGGGIGHRFEENGHSNYGSDATNKEHIKEHLKALAGDTGTPVDLDDKDMVYYLFVLHDRNGDGYLDGHELRGAFSDFDVEHEEDPAKYVSLEDITSMVDHVLEEDDLDGDGKISWEEYMQSQLYHGGL